MREKWDNFKRENQKPIKQYQKLLGWSVVWLVTCVSVAGISAILMGITYELVR